MDWLVACIRLWERERGGARQTAGVLTGRTHAARPESQSGGPGVLRGGEEEAVVHKTGKQEQRW